MVRPGDRVSDRYQVIEQLAAGGMGTLWRAHHVELDVDVALKVISGGATTPGALKRFKREAQAAARLRSPNIVQVLDFGVFEGEPYLAMELLKGEDLAELLAREGRLPVERCLKILEGATKAVQLAHEADIVHRDLKPANIFLEKVAEEEVVKILDFGVAKDLRLQADPHGTTSAGAVGSPAYMSPEQVWNEQVGPRADIWALGVVSFEMLTGENPFTDDTLAKVFERIIRAPLPKISGFDPQLSMSFDAFFERAFARTAADRIPTAKAFLEQFRDAAGLLERVALRPLPTKLRAGDMRSVSPFATTRGRTAGGARNWSAQKKMGWLIVALLSAAVAGFLILTRRAPAAHESVAGLSGSAAATPALATARPSDSLVAAPVAPPGPAVTSVPSVIAPPETQRLLRPSSRPQQSPKKPAVAPSPATTLDPKFGIPL